MKLTSKLIFQNGDIKEGQESTLKLKTPNYKILRVSHTYKQLICYIES